MLCLCSSSVTNNYLISFGLSVLRSSWHDEKRYTRLEAAPWPFPASLARRPARCWLRPGQAEFGKLQTTDRKRASPPGRYNWYQKWGSSWRGRYSWLGRYSRIKNVLRPLMACTNVLVRCTVDVRQGCSRGTTRSQGDMITIFIF